MEDLVDITVYGSPAPQGSKKAFMPRGARFPTMVESAGDKLKDWRATITLAAGTAMGERPAVDGPVCVKVIFFFLRPKAHFGTGRNNGQLKASAPDRHTKMPDVDKLARSGLDSLTGVVFRDDSQVVELTAGKAYAEKAGAHIHVSAF